ncbi:MAG: head GIN domain-containing protein [Bacteroidales bacterium]
MKSLRILLITAMCFALISCVDAQFYKTVRGNGNVVKKDREASYFDGVKVSTGIDVYLTQGDKEKIVVEADENIHEYLKTEIKGNVLHIYFDNVSIRDAETKKVYVTMKDVRSVKTSSAGDIYGETPIKTNLLEVGASSAGDIKLEVRAREVRVDISSSGNVTLTGEAEMLEADLSSAGDLEAADLVVKEANVDVSSAGDARVNVSEKLVARASSAGDITYWGNPKYIDAHASSAGGIRKR